MSTFSIDQPFLNRMLNDIRGGKIQLPDFQRGWVWDDYRIRSLIASVSQEFPIGSVLTLKANGADVSFKPRLIEGVNSKDANRTPETFILDGQQRLTALFQSLMSERAVFTKNAQGREIRRYYYLDMKACTRNETEREEAVISCGEDHLLQIQISDGKTKTINLSSIEEQYANNMFPVHKIFASADWRKGYYNHWKDNSEKIGLLFQFDTNIIQCFGRYSVPVIELNGIPREAVCMIFEKVNTGGVTLTVFELLTASFAADDFQLRKDWNKREKCLKESPVLKRLDSTSFLRALTLLVTNANSDSETTSCTRRGILGLKKKDYEKWADQVEHGFAKVARFLHTQKIFNAKDVPYQTQLVPLAAILTDLGKIEEIEGAEEKIARWFWCGVFGEMYAGSTDTRAANDFCEVTKWVKGNGEVPTTIRDARFSSSRLLQLERRTSAAYKGVLALIMHDRTGTKCCDFLTRVAIDEEIFFDDKIDIHHIFPQKWCQEQNIESKDFNCIINKTAISARTNRKIGKKPPSQYLQEILEETPIDTSKMKEILASHLIPADILLSIDDKNGFLGFFEARKEALLNAIEKVMGENKVVRDSDDQSDISK